MTDPIFPFEIDDLPLDFIDSDGISNIMASCGHRVREKGLALDTKIAMCVWCDFFSKALKRPIPARHPDRVPDEFKIKFTTQKDTDGKEWKIFWNF